MATVGVKVLTHSLRNQIFPECHPWVGLSFTEVPAGYVLWCRCMVELHVLNDEYTHSSVAGLDWIEQCFTSPPTQYRLYGRRF